MNAVEAKEAVKKYGSQRAAERALGLASGSICNAIKRGVGAPKDTPTPERKDVTDGINLSPATRVLDRRPPTTVRSKFWSLPKAKAFRIADLVRQWGFSAETIRRHARDEGCFAYIDTTGHDDFEECVMHPETAAKRLKGNK